MQYKALLKMGLHDFLAVGYRIWKLLKTDTSAVTLEIRTFLDPCQDYAVIMRVRSECS